MKSIKKWILVPVLLLVLVGCFAGCASDISEERLTEQEILDLREQYPLCSYRNTDMGCFSTDQPTIEDHAETAETFVYGKISGEVKYFSKNISTGDIELDQKREANGLSNTYDFFTYSVVVLDDSAGIYEKGTELDFTSNAIMRDATPMLTDGMEILIPITRDEDDPESFDVGRTGIMYVTDDGYAINAYEGADETKVGASYSGMQVEALLKKLRKG